MALLHDEHMFSAFQSFTAVVSDNVLVRNLVQLPIKLNGAGISSAVSLAPLAYVSSVADGLRFISAPPFDSVRDDITRWASAVPAAEPIWGGAQEVSAILSTFRHDVELFRELPGNYAFQEAIMNSPTLFPSNTVELLASDSKLQHRLSLIHHEISHAKLQNCISPAVKASLLSNRQQGASLCFNVIPTSPELVISNEVFHHFIASHLCIRLLDNQGITLCSCAMPAASLSLSAREVSTAHLDNCPLGGGTVDRHDALARVVAEFFTAGGFLVHKDFHKQGPSVLKPDLTVFDFPSVGLSSFVEVSVTNPLAAQSVRNAATTPLSAASACEVAKINKYKELARSENRGIFTFVLESTGAFGKGVKEILATVCANADTSSYSRSAICSTKFPPSFKKFWSQRFAISFWQGSYQMQRARARSATFAATQHTATAFARHTSHAYHGQRTSSVSSYMPSSFRVNLPV
jgi:hypothetical protein